MKNRILLLAAISAICLTGCSLDREYLNGPNASTFPASVDEVEAGVYAAYKGLSLLNASSTPFPGIQDNATDIGAGRLNTSHYTNQVTGKITPSSSLVTKYYEVLYKTIGRANLVLDSIDNIKDQMTEQEYNMYKAELLLVRSFCYDMACQMYGDVPYLDHTLALGDTYTRTPREEVISNILDKDLKDEMLEFLPLRHNKTSYGFVRLGRVGAYGLKARICLNWGRYEDAAKYADLALTLSQQAGYSLTQFDLSMCGKDYTEGEPLPTPLFGVAGSKSSDEWIWGLEFNTMISSNQHNAGYYAAPRIAGGCSYFSPTQAFIDAIQCADGKSIVESGLYNWEKPWLNRDPRLDLYCVRPGTRVLGIQFDTNPSVQEVLNYNNDPAGVKMTNSEAYGTKSEYGANGSKGPCGYLWRKFLDIEEYKYNSGFGTRSVCILSYPIMRLAELYLIRAEANIEWDGGDLSIAKSDIETVRARVNMPALTDASRDDLRSALRYERMVELCNEGFRWFDIRRWGIAETVISGTLYAPALNGAISNAKPTIDENWHSTYQSNMSFDGKEINLRKFLTYVYDPQRDVLWPIPEDEIVANPLMTQNPGYAGAAE